MSDLSVDLDAKFRIFWHSTDPTKILLATDDAVFTGDDAGAGLKIAFSSNPDSRDYNPRYFNRCVRLLEAEGKQAPAQVPETSRRI